MNPAVETKDAEKAFLGCLLIDPSRIDEAKTKIPDSKWLRDGKNRQILDLLYKAHAEGKTIDSILIADMGADRDRIYECETATKSTAHMNDYALAVGRERLREAIHRKADTLEPETVQDLIPSFLRRFRPRDILPVREIGADLAREVMNEDPTIRIHWPWRKIDFITGGIQPKLIFIGANSSHNKTTASVCVANHVLKQGFKVLYADYEMGPKELFQNFVCGGRGIPRTHIKTRRDENLKPLSQSYRERMSMAIQEYSAEVRDRLMILDRPFIHEIKAEIKAFKPDVVFVDHIQLFFSRHENTSRSKVDADHRNDLCADLKQIVLAQGIPIICPSQTNERDYEGPPLMYHYKGTGGISENADIMLSLWWPYKAKKTSVSRKNENKKAGKNLIEFELVKHRAGPTGHADLYIDPTTGIIQDEQEQEVVL